MPRITKERMSSGPWSAVSYDGRLYTPERMSEVRCGVCRMLLVDALAEAGETTHPTCAGWPQGAPRTEAIRRARAVLAGEEESRHAERLVSCETHESKA